MKIESAFKPAWWLPSSHLQTLWPVVFGAPPLPTLRRERFELADGDFVDIDWNPGGCGPIVLLLHGLEGSVCSPYGRRMMHCVQRAGWRGAAMHFRGCSGELNRLDRTYHSGDTGDVDAVFSALIRREPGVPLLAVGYSLGGNVLLKWLGEKARDAPIAAAVAVSVPFLLDAAASRLSRGFSRIYQRWLLRSLRTKMRAKFRGRHAPFDLTRLNEWSDFRRFDDRVTAPLHGFSGADEYYARSSSRQFLKKIRVPTLILHSLDDPFLNPDAVPDASELSPATTLELSRKGGHVGFVSGRNPLRARYWLEERIEQFLRNYVTKKT